MERATKDAPPGVIRPLRSELLPAFGAAIREAEMFVSAGDVENLVRLGFIHGFEARGGPAAPMTCADEAGITAAQFKIGDVVQRPGKQYGVERVCASRLRNEFLEESD